MEPSDRGRRGMGASGSDAGKGKSKSAARGGVRTLSDLGRDRDGSDSDSDRPQEYYTGGEKSGMMVQDPTNRDSVDSIFNRARQLGALEAADMPQRPTNAGRRSFAGVGRTLTGDPRPEQPRADPRQPPEPVMHTITFWRNGFTVDDGPLRTLSDPANRPFLESIEKGQCPHELEPSDRRVQVSVDLVQRSSEDWKPPPEPKYRAFGGTGRTLGSSSVESQSVPSYLAAPSASSAGGSNTPAAGLVIDDSKPITSIQLRLLDGTRMVARFNHHHTVGDIRRFIDAARPGGSQTNYHLQAMGFPPKILSDPSQTVKDAQLVNSVVIQKA
ncbi:hypothetical protein CBR_g40738 [Chara braunii]|uniref:UBX domain-containing protein n=1 Tax=Chara braunii TaxID=69332 RepID=A0A388LUH8_CHABU|nr:hypothetical protein CBR_g40738 [Chara braunii]|eukprot:GBG85925.1 hypothetical protein CBR_g40738 [Chara braunii]